jgi:hypothetical protein
MTISGRAAAAEALIAGAGRGAATAEQQGVDAYNSYIISSRD